LTVSDEGPGQPEFRIHVTDEKGNLVELNPRDDSQQAVVRVLESLRPSKPEGWVTPLPGSPPVKSEEPLGETNLETIALALGPDDFLRTASQRARLVFGVNLAILIALAMILLVGIGGSVISGLAGESTWAVIFAGASLVDIVGC
jgi:hypothetical protein